jgi:hypothetical protein
MAQTGYTPILIYSSSTASNTPSSGNLTNSTLGSELAINITDGKLFYKDNSGSVQVIGWKVRPANAGGTGITSYSVGDLLYADTSTTLAKLADVATGNALISGGVGVAPSWGKIGLTTHVSGVLPTANGGTNLSSITANQLFYASSTSAFGQSANLTYDGTTFTVTAVQKLQGITTTLGNSAGIANNSAILRFNGWNTGGANWQIDTASISTTNELAFTPSTAAGGLTFTTLSQSFRSNGTIGVGTSGSTSGSGITFPAAQSASTDVNTLDDYEEGTFTVTGQDQSGNQFPSYTNRSAAYTKIGRLVYVYIYLRTGGSTTGMTTSQVLKITGLPFTPASFTASYIPCAANLTRLSPATYLELLAYQNGTSLDIYSTGGGGAAPYGPTNFTVNNFENGNGSEFFINFVYTV